MHGDETGDIAEAAGAGQPSRRDFLHRFLVAGGAAAVTVLTGSCTADESTPPALPDLDAPLAATGPSSSRGGMVAYADFTGITTDGTVLPDLYGVRPTGVPTAAVVAAGTTFVATLTPAQRATTVVDVRSDRWLNWSNVHTFARAGLRLKDMTPVQRGAGLQLLAAALSAQGFRKSTDIRRLNHVAGRLLGQLDEFDEDLYHFTVLGTPSASEPWGFQFQGHHLVVTCFVLGDQVVLTPTFMGSEPRVGFYDDGTRIEVFAAELAAGVAMINALDDGQRSKAITSATKTGSNTRTEAGQDNAVVPAAGIRADDLTAAQQRQLLDLVGLFVGNIADGHAAVKMAEVRARLAATYFAWVGPTTADAAFYFRVQSPVILVEFDCQSGGPAAGAVGPAALPANATAAAVAADRGGGGTADTAGAGGGGGGASRNHIHVVVRTPNGNDYGFDLLAEHLARHPHPSGSPSPTPTATPSPTAS